MIPRRKSSLMRRTLSNGRWRTEKSRRAVEAWLNGTLECNGWEKKRRRTLPNGRAVALDGTDDVAVIASSLTRLTRPPRSRTSFRALLPACDRVFFLLRFVSGLVAENGAIGSGRWGFTRAADFFFFFVFFFFSFLLPQRVEPRHARPSFVTQFPTRKKTHSRVKKNQNRPVSRRKIR